VLLQTLQTQEVTSSLAGSVGESVTSSHDVQQHQQTSQLTTTVITSKRHRMITTAGHIRLVTK
jgi:hypothetical protein